MNGRAEVSGLFYAPGQNTYPKEEMPRWEDIRTQTRTVTLIAEAVPCT